MSTTTSDRREAYVWTWLAGERDPVVAGRLEPRAGRLTFVYAASYRARAAAIPLYLPELPLRAGRIWPLHGLSAPGCILDARPDSWGQRVILNRLTGASWSDADPGEIDDLTYLLESGSDRAGALDFQASPEAYVARGGAEASLEELATGAERLADGLPLSPQLDAALLHGTSIGGARPKAVLRSGSRQVIAKFSAAADLYPVVQAEYVAMRLAGLAGLDVATVGLTSALGKSVLLVDRFDRTAAGGRTHFVSALTMLGLDELAARHASYADLVPLIRSRFVDAPATLRELFARITFNILIGNTDDHARNHAAFWDGATLRLTPAYDLCPQLRSGGEASQGMMIGADGYRLSNLRGCIDRSLEYGLGPAEARAIVDAQIAVIERHWAAVCDEAGLSEADRTLLRRRAVLLPYALEGYTAR